MSYHHIFRWLKEKKSISEPDTFLRLSFLAAFLLQWHNSVVATEIVGLTKPLGPLQKMFADPCSRIVTLDTVGLQN